MKERKIWIFTFSAVVVAGAGAAFWSLIHRWLCPTVCAMWPFVNRLVFYSFFIVFMRTITDHAVEWSEDMARKEGFRWVK